MKTEGPDPLLDSVLDEDAVFRRATLQQTIALARRRRRARLAGRALATVAVLIAGVLLLRLPPRVPETKSITVTSPLRVVRSAPLAARESVRTRAGLFASIKSVPSELAVVVSQPNGVFPIATRTSAPMLDYLDDRQLLAAFPGQHPALIASGTAEARLVFY